MSNVLFKLKHSPRMPKHLPIKPMSAVAAGCKRSIDIFASLMALMLLTPVMLGCALWIWWMDGGPVLYTQWRVGENGWFFRIYKFRTMRKDAEANGVQLAKASDNRIIPGCHWMRTSHLDELPQLVNILRGQMSLVGPRPERPEVIDQLQKEIPQMELRLAGTPGLTGLAQVRNGYSNDLDGMKRKLAYDLQYLANRSVFKDVKLILATIPKFWDRAAC